MDDVQIGGGSGASMGPTAAEKADNSGPLEKRIISKNWSVRAGAYDELLTLCKNSEKGKEPHFQSHIDQWKEYLKDNNPGSLEKCLLCLEAFVDKVNRQTLAENQNPIITALVDKCLGHVKPVIKNKAQDVLLLIFEVSEDFDNSIDTLLELVQNKNIKTMISGTQALALLVEWFGVKKLKIANFAEQMLKNAQNTNPQCKQAAYDFYKAVYKWIGDAILPQIEDKLKKAQIDDLKKAFEEVKAKGSKEMRFTRSEKKKEEERKKNEAIDAAIAEEKKEEEPAFDPLEFAPEVDISSKFDGIWQDETAAIKKWDDKVARFQQIIDSTKNVKIKNGNFQGLFAFLKKEVAAVNVNTSIAAIKASGSIGNGLKKDKQFVPYAKEIIPAVLLKLKEKKQNVIDEVNNFLEVVLVSCNMEDVKDEVIPAITNVAPGVKLGTIKFVEKMALVTYIDVLKRVQPELIPAIVKVIDDKDGGVRDAALHCAGILKGRLGEDTITKYVKDLVPQKAQKIDEAKAEVKPSKYDRPENYKPPAPKPAAPPKKKDAQPGKVQMQESETSVPAEGDDDLMVFDTKPKKAPPKGIGQKPPSKKKAVEDEEMKDEDVPKPPPPKVAAKKPALSSEKPVDKPKTVASSSKGPSAPVVQEEDLGGGLSAEEAIEKVRDNFSGGIIKNFEEAKWQSKQEGFASLRQEIVEKQPGTDVLEAVAKFVKAKMKDWKESNINLQKEIVGIFNCMVTECECINKRTMQCAMVFFVDKIGDVKLSSSIKPMLLSAAEVVTPKFICLQVIKHAASAKAPNTIKDSADLLTQMIDEFGISNIPLKETIDFAKVAANHATPAVRQQAMALFCEIYKHVGEVIRNFMTEIKESTMKVIDAELNKTTQYKKGEHQKKRSFRGEAATTSAAGGPAGKQSAEIDPLAALPREDISKKLNPKLMEQFKNKDWKIRKKAGDDVEALLREAKMRIECNGLNELMDAMKNGMKDPNKAVVKVYISLLGLLAEAIGPNVKQFTKKSFVPMINNLSDKQSLVRADVIVCMNKWSDQIGAASVINQLVQLLVVENPEQRGEGLKWMLDNKESLKDTDIKAMVNPLLSCLTDKSKAIRDQTEQIIAIVMPFVGYNEFLSGIKNQKTAIQQTLKPILEKIKSQCGAGNSAGENAPAPVKAAPPKEEEKKQEEQKELKSQSYCPPDFKPQKKDQIAEDDDSVKITPANKSKRADADSKTKFPLNEVKGDHLGKLQQQIEQCFGQKFSDQMFAKAVDFKKHLKCVEVLDKQIEHQPSEMIEVLDLIFKWANLRMAESSNTQLSISILDFFQSLLKMMQETGYQMQDFEAQVLIGTLCDKSGINNKGLQDKIRKLIKNCYEVFDSKACYRIVIEQGVKNKNLKSVAECLDEVSEYVARNGVGSVTKKDFTLFTQMADNADKGVRENSLKVFAECYAHLGEKIWTLLGEVPMKVKGLLEQRFKTVGKNVSLDRSIGGMNQSAGGLNMSIGGSMSLKFKSTLDSNNQQSAELQKSIKDQNQSLNPSLNPSTEPVLQDSQMEEIQPQQLNPSKPESPKISQPQESNLQDVFAGRVDVMEVPLNRGRREQDDVEMKVEDEVAQLVSKPRTNRPMNEDDVEMQDKLRQAEHNLNIDPDIRKKQQEILLHINRLKTGELLGKVDSLVALNEVINEHSDQPSNPELQNQTQALLMVCDELINAYVHVIKDVFKYPVDQIPIRFTKYFITIVNKTCSSKTVMKEISEQSVNDLVEQLLTRLLIDNLDKIGQNKEGDLILKNLNSSMLRMLENCNHTYIFTVLFGLMKKYQNDDNFPKLPGLIIKCLLKLSKLMDQLIEKIDLKRFLLAVHEYLSVIDHNNKTTNDDLGIRIVKTLVNEIVGLKGDKVWESYQVIESHATPDTQIKKWIQIILKSKATQQKQGDDKDPNNQSHGAEQPQSKMYIEFEIKKIIQDLKDPSKFEAGLQRLDKFAKNNPTYDYTKNLQKESEFFSKKVLNSLSQLQSWNSHKSTSGSDSIGGKGQAESQQDKMAAFKQKMGSLNQSINQFGTRRDSGITPMSGLNKSSDLNSSLSKAQAFESKMAMLQQKNAGKPQPVQQPQQQSSQQVKRFSVLVPGDNAVQSQQNPQNLNTSFSQLNTQLQQKWAAINSGSKKFSGGQTVRNSNTQSSTNLAQTLNSNFAAQNSSLNNSNNKFQQRVQGNFASRVQQNKPESQPSERPQTASSTNLVGQTGITPSAGGGIQTSSFRSRIQGLGNKGGVHANTNIPSAVQNGAGQTEASSQDLQRRLAEMKARLQGLKKD